MRLPRLLVLPGTLVLLAACPSPAGDLRPRPPQKQLDDPGLAALRLAPPRSTYFVVARRLSTLVEAARALLETLRAVDANLTVDRLDQLLRKDLGISPLRSLELEDAGLEVTASAALFSTGISPTVVLKVGDPPRLARYLAGRIRSVTTNVRSHRGVEVTSWSLKPGFRISSLQLRGYWVLHLESWTGAKTGPPSGDGRRAAAGGPVPAWLDAILDAAESGRGPTALEAALAAAGDRRDLVAYADPGSMARAAAARRPRPGGLCADGDLQISKARQLAAGVALRGRALRMAVQVALTAAARADLTGTLQRGPRLPADLWERAPARAEWQVDPRAVSSFARGLGQPGCGWLQEWLGQLGAQLNRFLDRHRGLLQSGLRSVSAALLAADEKGQGTLLLRGAVIAPLPEASSRAFLERQLPLAPGEEQLAGRPVRSLSPSKVLAEAAQVCFGDGLLRLSGGDGMMEQLLKSQGVQPPDSLLRMELDPGGLADLRAALKLLDDGPPKRGAAVLFRHLASGFDGLDRAAAWIAAFSRLRLSAEQTRSGLRLALEYELR